MDAYKDGKVKVGSEISEQNKLKENVKLWGLVEKCCLVVTR